MAKSESGGGTEYPIRVAVRAATRQAFAGKEKVTLREGKGDTHQYALLMSVTFSFTMGDSGRYVSAIKIVVRSTALLRERCTEFEALRCFLKCEDLQRYLLSGGISNQ